MTNLEELSQWNRDLSEAIAALGSDDFFPALVSAIKAQVDIDLPQVWLYNPELPPSLLFHRMTANATTKQIDEYLHEHYQQDPFYLTAIRSPRNKIYRLSRICMSDFEQSNYFRCYFCHAGAIDEVAFSAKLTGNHVINLKVKRRHGQEPFSDQEYENLYLMAEPVSALLQRHFQHDELAATNLIQPSIDHYISLAFRTFGSSILSPREKDVLELMLRGYGTGISAERLSIAIETVRRHRKNIYRKLDVNSQTDLFSLFINSMSCLGQAAGEDPLKIYMG